VPAPCGRPANGPYCAAHGVNRRTLTTSQRGYGYHHQQRRAALLANAYGTPCPICEQTMTIGQRLDLDHSTPLIVSSYSVGNRIVHASCNRGRRRPAPGGGGRLEGFGDAA
jgi:hypothetical protein